MSLLIVNVLVLGVNFCLVLIGGLPFKKDEEIAPVHMAKRTYSVEIFALAVSVSVLGWSSLLALFYFLIAGRRSFAAQFDILLLHAIIQLLASAALIFAGYAIFNKWRRFRGILLAAIALLYASTGVAIVVYGPIGNDEPMFMYLFGVWTLIIGGIFTTAVYLLDRMVHEWDEQLVTRS